jgi:hypothetical protein
MKNVKQLITTSMSTTCTQQGIRFNLSSEQDGKVGLNYFRFNKIDYHTYQTAENRAQKILLRGVSSKVTAETGTKIILQSM